MEQSLESAAYFTLAMLGDVYVEPAMTLGKSIINAGSKVKQRYCLVTNDVSDCACRELSKLWTVLNVDYLSRSDLPPLISNRMSKIYGSWIQFSFTKFRFLEQANLLDVTRLMYLDADTVMLRNMDHLFVEIGTAEKRIRKATIASCLYPFFSTLLYHRSVYYKGPLLTNLSKFEKYAPSKQDYVRANWQNMQDVWLRGLKSKTNLALRAPCTRHFLMNLSLVYMMSSSTCSFGMMFQQLKRCLYDDKNELLRSDVSCFPNSWDEQLFVQGCLSLRHLIVPYHLRTRCNVNSRF
jgi:hypothetical protein